MHLFLTQEGRSKYGPIKVWPEVTYVFSLFAIIIQINLKITLTSRKVEPRVMSL